MAQYPKGTPKHYFPDKPAKLRLKKDIVSEAMARFDEMEAGGSAAGEPVDAAVSSDNALTGLMTTEHPGSDELDSEYYPESE